MTHIILPATTLVASAGVEAFSWSLIIAIFGAAGAILRRRRAGVALAA